MELTKEQKSLLLALCIGDGCLRKPHPKSGNVQLEIAHSTKQEAYCKWKRDLIYQIFGGKNPPKIGYRTIKLKGNDKEYKACRFTKVHPYFTHLRKILYPDNIKVMTREILEMLNIQGIAIWYMDDGSFYKKDNKNGTKSICFDLRISTDSFSYEENVIICDFFKEKYGINFYPYQPHKDRKYSWIIRANKQAAIKFINLIKPYIIPEMAYKINYKDNNFHEQGTTSKEVDDIV